MFVIGAGVRSVVAQVFFPPHAPQSVEPCGRVLDQLHAELRDNPITGRSPATSAAASTAWQRAYRAAEPTCRGREHERWVALGRMRYALEALLTRYDEEVAPLDEHAGPSSSPSNQRTNE